MKNVLYIGGTALLLSIIAGVAWLRAAPTTTVGGLSATPAYVVVNTPSQVLFTVQITDPKLLPNGVNLLKVDANGRTLATVGVMRDDGLGGDAVPGDKVFSYRLSLHQPAVESSFYRASAAFKGVLQRTLSQVIPVQAWATTNASPGFVMAFPPTLTPSEPKPFPGGYVFSFGTPESNPAYGGPFTVFVRNNGQHLPLEAFFDGQPEADIFAESTAAPEELTINARRALLFRSVVGMQTRSVILIDYREAIIDLSGPTDQLDTLLRMSQTVQTE